MPSIAEIQQEIVEDFSWLGEWEEKYKHIIELGRELAPYPEEFRTEEFKVRGCQSQVWLHSRFENGIIFFEGDSDALIVKGLVALLLKVYNAQSPADILGTPLTLIDEIGLGSHLSPTRSNGLAAMIKQIRHYAVAYQSISGQK